MEGQSVPRRIERSHVGGRPANRLRATAWRSLAVETASHAPRKYPSLISDFSHRKALAPLYDRHLHRVTPACPLEPGRSLCDSEGLKRPSLRSGSSGSCSDLPGAVPGAVLTLPRRLYHSERVLRVMAHPCSYRRLLSEFHRDVRLTGPGGRCGASDMV